MNDPWINPLTDAVDGGPIEWPSPEARDEFVQMISQCIDACATTGYEAIYDGPQLAAWLESPVRRERVLASFHVGQIRHTVGELAGAFK